MKSSQYPRRQFVAAYWIGYTLVNSHLCNKHQQHVSMRLSSVYSKVLVAAACTSAVSAASFENTAPFVVSTDLIEGIDSKYIDTYNHIESTIESITENYCSQKHSKPLGYLIVNGLDETHLLESDSFINKINNGHLKVVSDHVVFKPTEKFSVSKLGRSCDYIVYEDAYDMTSKTTSNPSVLIFEIANDERINETINNIAEKYNLDNYIIQGVPTFEAPSTSMLKLTADKIKELLDAGMKREDINYDQVEKELKESFDEINQLIDDSIVSIYDDDTVKSTGFSENTNGSNKIANANGSLFDNYAFFSTGIWMSTIVFLFLAWLLSVALGWLGDLKISYAAFDKPIDFEKKLQ